MSVSLSPYHFDLNHSVLTLSVRRTKVSGTTVDTAKALPLSRQPHFSSVYGGGWVGSLVIVPFSVRVDPFTKLNLTKTGNKRLCDR